MTQMTSMEIIDSMIDENHNELERCKIMERMYARWGALETKYNQIRAMNQSKIETFKKSLDTLLDLRNDMRKETEPTSIPPAA